MDKSITGMPTKPTMHPDYPIGLRVMVKIAPENNEQFVGTITGVASAHIVFTYIITLDKPLTLPGYEGWGTIPGWGTLVQPLDSQ
jgi:hypothetical protein